VGALGRAPSGVNFPAPWPARTIFAANRSGNRRITKAGFGNEISLSRWMSPAAFDRATKFIVKCVD
jgi:hypothetical protein